MLQVVRNSSATRRLLANWNIAYHVLARHSSRLMDQPAFRVSLYRSAVGYRELPFSANCRGRNRRTKLAIPLACDGFRETSDHQAAKLGTGRKCVVLHSHELSIQSAEGPNGLPNFYGDRIVRPYESDFEHRYGANQIGNESNGRSSRAYTLSGSPPNITLNRQQFTTALPRDVTYWRAPAIFLHIPKAAGNSVKELFAKGFLKNHRSKQQLKGNAKAHSLHIDTRRDWDVTTAKSKKTHLVLYGAFAFGACASHSHAPCAYYVARRQSLSQIPQLSTSNRSFVSQPLGLYLNTSTATLLTLKINVVRDAVARDICAR